MAKVSKEGAFKVLRHVAALAALVIGGSASQQQQQGCCPTTTTTSGSGGDGAGGEGGDKNCVDNGPVDPSGATVSFNTEIEENILVKNCSVNSTCHASEAMGSSAQPYLGPISGTVTDIQRKAILADIVGVVSVKEPGMPIVDPGHPENSFLMYKIDHDLTCSRLKCTGTAACGDSMPQKADPLGQKDRDTVRRWIAQGALEN